jgi:hypothetical protein
MSSNIWYKIQFCILGILLVGCASAPVSRYPSTRKAESIYESITYRQSQPEDKVLRTDWAEEPYLSLETSYIYPIPYLPYLFSNFILITGKELALLIASPVIGGTQYQDNFDDWLIRSSISYEDYYYGLWSNERADYVNMDQARPLSEMESLPGASAGKLPSGNVPGNIPSGKTNTPSGNAPSNNTSPGSNSPGNTPSGNTPAGNAPGK